ncbi:MAG: shikimate kinase [Candidatus Pelagibacter sp. TMED275]|nr:MAG: shikimate kinase [Candidatus Pelagibacter sp. TMED275]|tara:strand:+ start:478 stop:999 length:522 start_codon:yes stop_codon:yes gene_type:complete
MNFNKINKNLVLVGMMGSGKTHLGMNLAKKLGYNFYDTDVLVEKYTKLKISKIFENFGEKYFRDIEEKITLDILKKKNSVISLGGGGYLNSTIRKITKKNCFSVWLKWDSKTLIERVKRNKNRPVIIKMNSFEIKKLIEQRSKIYSQTDVKIYCEGKIKKNIINKIIKLYEKI